MRAITILFLLFTQFSVSAQDISALSNKDLKNIYDDNLNFLLNKRENLVTDFQCAPNDIKNIIRLKRNKQRFINELPDSASTKRLMLEEIRDLMSLRKNFDDISYVQPYILANKIEVDNYLQTIDSLSHINGLEKCDKCPIARSVEFIVLKTTINGQLDTLRCVSAKHMKIGYKGRLLSETKFNTYPCNGLLTNLSLTGAYSKNMVEIDYMDNKKSIKITKEFPLYAGKSENDILILPIVITENN